MRSLVLFASVFLACGTAQSADCITYVYYISSSSQFIESSSPLTVGEKISAKRRTCSIGEKPPVINPFDKISYQEVEQSINAASKRFGVEANLIRSVIQVESGYSPNAVSEKGAKGLMQLMDTTANKYNVSDPFDPDANIYGGTNYLSDLIKQFDGNLEHALAAYNAGPSAVIKHSGIPPFKETKSYVERVLFYFDAAEKSEGAEDASSEI